MSIHFEAFEAFAALSRSHEDWELDELAMLSVNAIVCLVFMLAIRSRELARTAKERDAAEREAKLLARHDPLTGLLNRRGFLDHMSSDSAAHEVTMMMIDLDRFKVINDLHGHACGDHVLEEVASIITSNLGEGDVAARLGGDEFAVILRPGTSVDRAQHVARRIIASIAQPIRRDESRLHIGASIGLARMHEGQTTSVVLHSADQALYLAKRSGRGRFAWYDQELDRAAQERTQLEQDLRDAMGRDEIAPYLQPVYSIADGSLRGFEALARWNHPVRGMVSPEIFIPIAEDIGVVAEVGWMILRKACVAAQSWDRPLTLSVNFSPTQFRNPHLAETVREILAETGFDANRLEVEITESAIMLDFNLARMLIERLQGMGVSLALDDFGTGFSSLSHLRQLPFDRIKIDRSFIMGIQEQPENQKIVTGILALAHSLKLAVTAEGIQSEDDLAFLKSLDCELGQGFHLSHPLDLRDVGPLLASLNKNRFDAA
ncbi:putative bifunctional diguanylate cyclase/phosphodiesterase [Rhodobacter sp. NSM]|uniref:putative bifunctional diguanylate cyclase/phosphodiesterase n=1 Tax=Rhodobacter sp. NSM TaxID=3457501 RepID=UPI003FD3D8E8